MKLWTIWANEPNCNPWLVASWDEYSRDENIDGWLEAVDEAKRNSNDIKVILIDVDERRINDAFKLPTVIGEVNDSPIEK